MANCDPLTNIPENCETSSGGIQMVGITDFSNISSVTVVAGEVTAITMESTTQFHKFNFTKNSSQFSEPLSVDVTTGSTFYTHTLNLQIARREISKRNSIALLAAGQRELVALVKDINNNYWLVGYSENFEEGIQLTGDDGGSGAGKADLNGYNLTFEGDHPERILGVDPTIVADLLEPAL